MTDSPTGTFVITVTSRDRTGIVADVAGALAGLGGDIADLSQSVLRGYFTMILLVTLPSTVSPQQIDEAIATSSRANEMPLKVVIGRVEGSSTDPAVPASSTYLLTASGRDRIGFVADVARFCAQHDANILDLSTTVSDGSYVMMLLVDLSRCADSGTLRHDLHEFCDAAGLHAVLQHYDIFRATNEVDL